MKKQLLTLAFVLVSSFAMTMQAQSYCAAGPSSTYDSEITGVVLNGDTDTISRISTACGSSGVQNFTSTDSADVSQGGQYSISVTMGTCGGSYSGAVSAWIDFNNDGDFTDAGEQLGVYAGSPTQTLTWSFVVPCNANLGYTRLRVMQQEGGSSSSIAPCNTFSWGAVEDYSIVITNLNSPSCFAASDVSVTTTTTTAGLSWGTCGTYDHFVVEYDTTGFTPGTGDTVWVYADTAYLTGLASSTAYDFYVTTVCTSSSAPTASVTGVYTQCAAIATPWSENFDNGASGSYTNPSLPNCWEFYNGGTTSSYWYPYWYVYNYSTYANSGSQMLYGYKSSSTSTSTAYVDTVMAMTPVIQGLDSATKQLDFYSRNGSSAYPGMVIIGVTDALGTPSSLKIIDTTYGVYGSYTKQTVYLDSASGISSGDARVAFVWIRDYTADYAYIDDVSITDIPPCPEPIGLGLVSTTQTSATINWSSLSSNFNIEVGPTGFNQGTGSIYSSNTNSYTATGLTQNTYYDAYVMSNCTSTGDGTSNWVGPFTFKTECGDQAVPYVQGFEDQAGGGTTNPDLPDCWEYAKTGTSSSLYAYAYNSTSYSNTGSKSLRFYGYAYSTSTNNAFGDTLAAFSPRITGLGDADKQVIFNGRMYTTSSSYVSKIIVATADSNASLASISIVDTIEFTSTSYVEYTIDLDGVSSDASRVVFMMVPEYKVTSGSTQYGYNYAFIDDITIREIPGCPVATDFTGFATSDSSVTLTWTDSSMVNEYVIEWGPCGFTQGTGAPMDTIVGNTWSIDSLDDASCYDFYVLSSCSTLGKISPWVGPVSVDVPCSPTSAPWADGFETAPAYSGGNGNPNLPDCWAYDGTGGTSYSMAYGYNYYAYAGDYSLYNYMYANGGDTNVISTPMIQNLDQGGHVLTFYAKSISTSYPGIFNVVASDAMGNYETARILKSYNLGNNTSFQQLTVYLDSNTMVSGDQRVGFMMYSKSSYDYVIIDSVEINPMPSCVNYNHMASNTTDSSANLSWDYAGTNCFNVEYGATGFIQGTGVGALAGTVDSNVTSTHTLTGLNSNTTYDFYVESCCNPGTWEGPFTFTTECTGPLAAGTYSVGPTGDFATMDSVISTLNVCGIAGPVTFELQSGSHAGGTIGAVNGASSTNTITFSGASAANDTLGPLVLEGASYVNLEDLYIRATGGFTVRLNATEYVNITGCTIETSSAASTTNIPIVASASATSYSMSTAGEQYLTISDNTTIGGYFAMTFYGSSGSMGAIHDVEISNNTITDAYYYGIYIYYASNVEVVGNTIGNFTNNYNYGAYMGYIDGGLFSKNMVDSYYSVYVNYWSTSANAAFDSEVSNNMFKNGYYGLRVYYSTDLEVYHNTGVGSYYGLYDYQNGNGTDIRNNIFVGGTYALYSYNSSATLDYNLYHSLGTNLAYIYMTGSATSYPTDSASLAAVDTTMNQNSWVGDPIFAGANDLHVYGPLANDHGDNNVGITEDIDGDTRPMSGSTTVDIGADEFDVLGDDAALVALVSPTNGTCGDDSLMVSIEVANFGANTITSMTVSADVLGQTLSASPTGLSIPFGGTDTIELGYVSNYVGGPMSVVAYTQLTGDGRPGNDTLSVMVDIADAQQVSVNYPAMICSSDDAVLVPTHPTLGNLLWLSGNDTIAMAPADSTITLTGVTMDTTITVTAMTSTETLTTIIPTSSYSGVDGQIFTTSSPVTIDSVRIYPSATTGSEVITVWDYSTGATMHTTTVTWSTTNSFDPIKVPIGASVGVGTYVLYRGNPTGSWRESYVGTSAYPYYSSDSTVVLTGQTNYSSYVSYFYDWDLTVGGCDREDTTFTVEVIADPMATISVDTANATISSTDWTANWSTSGTSGADSVYVEFSNGTTSSDTSGTVTFTANMAGESVTVIAFGPCSSDTATFTFDVNQISVDEDFMNGTLSIYPNPTRGLFNVEFASAASKDVEISIVNMVGQMISSDMVKVNGVYQNQFDLSEVSAGVYFITFKTDEGVFTSRITVE